MKRLLLPLLLFVSACATAPQPQSEADRWRAQAERVTIVRDDWGIAHVRGKSDADAVFGAIYAQAEDDFNRVETNYLIALGRLAEAEGEKAIWQDLRARLYMDPEGLKANYAASPPWMQRLMDAWADGLNHYLATHPEVTPRAIDRFEPWMAMSFTEGSIGGDIERIDLKALEAFYATGRHAELGSASRVDAAVRAENWTLNQVQGDGPGGDRSAQDNEPRGSNGIAIAPRLTEDGNALLLINPHTSFFFRSELQMTSDEGLDAYGASTWGQFFIYQGFNENAGWMHTSSGVDVVDEFAETIERQGDRLFYRYAEGLRPVASVPVTVNYRAADGTMASRTFETYRTHHGPIVREADGKWIAFAMMHRPVEALQQSWLRTKADSLGAFLEVSELKANSSNATLFADSAGNIAYLHPQFIPVRDDRFDYTKPVDGANPATDWRGLHALAEAPNAINPPNGWVMNTNNWPYSAAGAYSAKPADFPRYMDMFGENHRGLHALKLLEGKSGWTLEGLRAAAYSDWQPAFAQLVPGLVSAWDALPAGDPLKAKLQGPVAALRGWDYRAGVSSVPTTLAMFWAEHLWDDVRAPGRPLGATVNAIGTLPPRRKLDGLAAAVDRLMREFGGWRTPWGEVNRFQRLTGDIDHPFSDAAPSTPVGFTSGRWGSLASFGAAPKPGTKRWYGTSGNSFVAVVEFGEDRVRAVAVTAGGESGDPASPHFNDQAERYATGNLREVYFYPDQLEGHTERVYNPGE